MYSLARRSYFLTIIKRGTPLLGLFFLFFPPHIKVFGIIFKTVYFFITIPAVLGAYSYLKNGRNNVIVRKTLLFMLIGCVYLILLSALGSFQDLSAVVDMVKGIIILFACYYFVSVYQRIYGERFLIKIFYDLNTVGVIHAVIVLLTFLSPEFMSFLYEFVSVTDKSAKYLFGEAQGYRYQGLVASGFSFLSTTHALLFVMGIWAFYMDEARHGLVRIIYFLLCQFLLVTSIALIGRTGFVVIMIFLIVFFLWQFSSTFRRVSISMKIIRLLSVALIFSLAVATVMRYSIDFDKYLINLRFAFEFIYTWNETGSILTSSTQHLLENEFFLPDNLFSLFFGTSNFGRSGSYIYSDVGWVLLIFGAGIIGLLFAFSFYFVGIYYSYRYRRINRYIWMFIVAHAIMIVVLNLKDYYFISHAGYSQLYFIIICAYGTFVSRYRMSQYKSINSK
jgi:hypothetical protein